MDCSILTLTNKYIVGVSGGVDSMVLLDMLICRGYDVVVCHVNYHYRNDSHIDTELVRKYCKHKNIILEELHDEPILHKGNFQDYARDFRYKFYKKMLTKHVCNGVILGHHFDDHIETIIMQKNKNNLQGYLGIKSKSEVLGVNIYRPLIELKKEYLYKYALDNNIPFHEDSTNFETEFTRDYIRNITLKQISKERLESLVHEANTHNELNQKKELEFIKMKYVFALYKKMSIKILEDDFVSYKFLVSFIHPPLISNNLVKEFKKQILNSGPNTVVDLPQGFKAIKEYDYFYITKDISKDSSYCLIFDEIVYDNYEYFNICLEGSENEGICIRSDDLPITIRTFKPGDYIKTSGGTKKLSRLFINNKVPIKSRASWPVVVNKKGDIILVPNIAKNIDYLYTIPNLYVLKLGN